MSETTKVRKSNGQKVKTTKKEVSEMSETKKKETTKKAKTKVEKPVLTEEEKLARKAAAKEQRILAAAQRKLARAEALEARRQSIRASFNLPEDMYFETEIIAANKERSAQFSQPNAICITKAGENARAFRFIEVWFTKNRTNIGIPSRCYDAMVTVSPEATDEEKARAESVKVFDEYFWDNPKDAKHWYRTYDDDTTAKLVNTLLQAAG